MGTVTGKGKPKGFKMIDEGAQVLHITDVKGAPRTNVTIVTMNMLNEEGLGFGGKYPQKYDLSTEGGYAAFYFLVKNGYDIDLDEGDQFDIEDLEDTYVLVDIIHKEVQRKDGTGTVIFANIKATIGPGEPFSTAAATETDDEDYD